MTKQRTHNRIKRIITLTLLLLAVSPIVYLLWARSKVTGKPTIKINYVAQYNEMSRPDNYSEQDNAAQLYQAAFACFIEMPEESRKKFPYDYDYRPQWPSNLDPELYRILTQWLNSNKQALEYASEAATKPYYWIPQTSPDNSLTQMFIPNLNAFNPLTRAMILQAIVDADQERFTEAFDRLRHICLIGRQLSEKSLIEQLVSWRILRETFHCAKLILSNTEVPAQELSAFQQFLEDPANQPEELDIWSERIWTLDLIQRLFTDNGRGNGHLILSDFRELFYPKQSIGGLQLMSMGSYRIRRDLQIKLDEFANDSSLFWKCVRHDDRETTLKKTDALYSCLDKMVPQTPWQMHSKDTTYQQQVLEIVNLEEDIFLAAFSRTLHKLFASYHEHTSMQSAMITILALTRYKIEKGQYPQTLEHLIDNGYMKTLPMDPYSDGPLIYRTTEDGFTLYSLGKNFKDDGGLHRQASDKKDFDDVFWPIWKPEEQQQKAEDPSEESMGRSDPEVEYF
jgi:hypothetical protein